MVEKGKIVAKKAYADWNRYSSYTESLHEAAIELIQIPRRAQTGKNSADIRLCVDAMDLAYSKDHIDTFVVVSGDSDFSPLVSKLKELGKHVIGLGMQPSTSDLLRDNCDEFIYYEDIESVTAEVPQLDPTLPELKKKAHTLLLEALHALRRESKERLWSSMIKDTMKRLKPSFNETYHGYRTFSTLLEDAQQMGMLELETDPRSGTYVVTRFGDEKPADDNLPRKKRRRRKGARVEAGTVDDVTGNGHETEAASAAPTSVLDDGSDSAPERSSREPRGRRGRRRSSAGSQPSQAPIDPKLPPETFDDEFLPWPEE
ncbi:MAG: NYN domain-containing protein, partial [Planctomycetaceae bacterium]